MFEAWRFYNRRMAAAETLLEVRDLHLAYGDNEVVHGLAFSLPRGAIGCQCPVDNQ